MFIYNSVLNHTRYRSTSPPGGNQVDGLPPALRQTGPTGNPTLADDDDDYDD